MNHDGSCIEMWAQKAALSVPYLLLEPRDHSEAFRESQELVFFS